MQIIDLRDKSNMHIQNAQDIARIFQSIGKSEQIRQERQVTTRILQAISSGGDVAGAALEPVAFGTGLEGFIQKLGASFAPQVSPMQQAIAARGVQQALPSPAEKARLEYYKSRQGTTAATAKRTATADRTKQWEQLRKQRELLIERKILAEGDKAAQERLERMIQQLDKEMDALTSGQSDYTPPALQQEWDAMTPGQRTERYLGQTTAATPTATPTAVVEPRRQYSASRGQSRVSYDGGATWQVE